MGSTVENVPGGIWLSLLRRDKFERRLSGTDMLEMRDELFERGFSGYIPKKLSNV